MKKALLIPGLVCAAVLAVAVMLLFRGGNVSEIRELARTGSDEAAMIAAIEKSSQPYKLSADDIIALKKDGVPDAVVVRMIQHKP